MKGIILAGGSGTRLYPITIATSKQLLPIYDKPMIYYPLSVLILAKLQEILIISTPADIEQYQKLLQDGSQFGLQLSYAVQPQPKGLAEAFLIGEKFIGSDEVCLILGDNVFYGQGFSDQLAEARRNAENKKATIFGYYVHDPREFGVVSYDHQGQVLSIEEKPKNPKSHYAVPGLYFYPNNVVEIARQIQPSLRGELEITSINKVYLERAQLQVELLGRGMAWLDTGTYDGLLSAANYVQTVQKIQGLYVACLEEIAFRQGFISREALQKQAEKLKMTSYGQYLLKVSEEDK